eukprot:354737-Chlamydomonas_euryale.AAC.2
MHGCENVYGWPWPLAILPRPLQVVQNSRWELGLWRVLPVSQMPLLGSTPCHGPISVQDSFDSITLGARHMHMAARVQGTMASAIPRQAVKQCFGCAMTETLNAVKPRPHPGLACPHQGCPFCCARRWISFMPRYWRFASQGDGFQTTDCQYQAKLMRSVYWDMLFSTKKKTDMIYNVGKVTRNL